MHRSLFPLSAALVLAIGAPARAATITVKPGDGTLQAALDAAQDGDVLELKSGVYRGGFTRSDISNLTIRGKGRVVLDARVRGTDPTTAATVLDFTRVAGLTIEGITIRNATNDGIFLTDCSGFVLRRCKLEKCGDSGVEDRDTAGYTVDRCSFRKCSWGLATGYNSSATGVSITKSRFNQISSHAIDLWSSGALVESNVITSGGATGVYLRPGFSGVTVNRNRITGVGAIGIEVDGGSHTITFNEVRNVKGDGIWVEGTDGGNTFSDNFVLRARGNGFTVASSGNTFTRNKAKKSGGFDFASTRAQSANTFDGNVFKTTSFPDPMK